ncbi:MAG: site-specific DNA-methyltransferase [Bacteroidales bacterium]|jgi:DNA modification methylase|nr:site-specific DNA-methyltransferase [Bacteroidales bacterium]
METLANERALELNTILCGDAREVLSTLPAESIDCCVTSPPYYGLRDYGIERQIGREQTPEQYIENLAAVFAELYRVLKNGGTFWLNIGDTYWGGKGKSGESSFEYQANRYESGKSFNQPYSNTGKAGVIAPKQGKHFEIKHKDLIGVPWMLAFTLRKQGWYIRQEIIWHKPNPLPESVKDRCTKSHEIIFLLSKRQKYYFNHSAIMEKANYDGRKKLTSSGSSKYSQSKEVFKAQPIVAKEHNIWTMVDGVFMRRKRSVWTIPTKPLKEAHFAPFPEALIIDCVKAGCRENGVVIDPFMGSGTTAIVAKKLNRNYIGIELKPEYIEIAQRRIQKEVGLF